MNMLPNITVRHQSIRSHFRATPFTLRNHRYPGMRGADAVADAIFGAFSPAGDHSLSCDVCSRVDLDYLKFIYFFPLPYPLLLRFLHQVDLR